jgi:hypothetical protein
MDNFITAGLYTLLMAGVAFYYWLAGHKKGVTETLVVFNEHEPEAVKRVQQKVRNELNAADS